MSFPAYPSYRDSGLEWMPALPVHWGAGRLRWLAKRYSGGTPDRNRLEYWEDGTIPWLNSGAVNQDLITEAAAFITEEAVGNSSARWVPARALVMALAGQGKTKGMTAQLAFTATCNQSMAAIVPNDRIEARFLLWWLRANYQNIRNMSGGDNRDGLNLELLGDIACPLPPLDEQGEVAAFLDRETVKIDALIEEQRRLIALLKEKRQAVISHTVTNGLDPYAPMKDSGIEWLGEVPAHWTVAPLKRTAAVLAGYAFAANGFLQNPNNPRLLRGINLSASGIRWNEDTVYWERSEGDGLSAWELRAGDVVLGMDRPWIGGGLRVAEITESDLPCMLLQRVAAVRANCPSVQRFILHCLRHEAFFHHCAPEMTGVSVPHISGGQIEEFRMPIPPAEEMNAIAAHIDNQSNKFAALISAAQSAIELLGERRAALISAAVTGKIDVRKSAKVLPFPVDRVRARGLVAAEIIEHSAHQATFGRVKLQKIAFLTEAHVGVHELAGSYMREAAGPLDRAMIDEMEGGARSIAGVTVNQSGGTGTAVSYGLGQRRGVHRKELADWLGTARTTKLDKLIADFSALTTRGAEAVATLYGVWNDALIEGASPTDEDIIFGFLNNWHPEKPKKFRANELPEWLSWMRRHGIVPTGTGPKTATERLFA